MLPPHQSELLKLVNEEYEKLNRKGGMKPLRTEVRSNQIIATVLVIERVLDRILPMAFNRKD